MADDIANILIRLGADTSEGDKKLEEFRKELAQFGIIKETAEAKIAVKGDDKLKTAVAALNAWDRTRVTAVAEVKVDEAPLEAALRKVREFGASRTQVPGISPHPSDLIPLGPSFDGADPATEKLGRLRRTLDDLKNHFQNFFAPVGRGFDDLRGRSSLLDKAVDTMVHGLSDGVLKFGPALLKATEGFASFLDTVGGKSGVIGGSTSALAKAFRSVAESGPEALGGVVALAALAAAGINALIATVLALGASLAAAAGGVVALGIAFAAALGPAVLVAIGVFQQLATVIQAVSTGRAQSAKQVDALKAATLQQQAAQLQLTKATTSGNQSAVSAIQQQKDAVLALANAYLGLQSAKLGITDAALALEKANLDLKQFKANLPAGLTVGGLIKKAQDISVTGGGPQNATPAGGGSQAAELQFDQLQQAKAHALLGVQQAAQRVADATNSYAKAQVAVTGGVSGTTRATNAATAAADRLARANIAVQRAQLAVDKAKGTDKINTLSKAGRDLIPIFTKLADAVKKTFGPAIDAVLHSIGVAAKALLPLVLSLQGPFKELGKVMGAALLQVVKALSAPEMVTTFKTLIKDSGRFIQAVTPGFIALLKIFLLIAKDAMPALLLIMRKFSDILVGVAAHPKELARVIDLLVNSFRAWGGLILQVIIVLGKFIGLAAPLGNGLVKQVTALVKRFGDFLSTKKGRDEVIGWLKRGIEGFKNIVKLVVDVIHAFAPLIRTAIHLGNILLGLEPIVRVLGEVIHTVFTIALSPLNLFLNGLDLIREAVKWIIDHIPDIKLPNLTGSVSLPFVGNVNPLHAEGGIATQATAGIFGEAGPEGIIPLTDRVFAQLGAAIAPNIARHLTLTGVHGGKTVTQTNHIAVNAPRGHSPDTNHFIAAIENKLDALGAAA